MKEMRMRIRPWPVALSLAAFMMFLWVGSAAAHNVEMTRSDPAAGMVLEASPTQVKAWFNEEMKTQVSTIDVFDAHGQQVDLGDGDVDLNDPYHASMAVSLPSLPDGVYTVRWHVVLLDGDATDGEFAFYVGERPVNEIAIANQASAPAAPVAPAQEPVGDGAGFPVIWLALGFGALVLGAGLVTLTLRSRAVRSR